jgi:protein-disulfide isomerase/uncharacterized membrane protein
MLLIIAVAGLIISYYYRIGQILHPSSVCIANIRGCEALLQSKTASIIFGIPNTALSMLFFSLIIVYTIYQTFIKSSNLLYYTFTILSIIASLFAGFLTIYQFISKSFCPLCLVITICTLISSYLIVSKKEKPLFKDGVAVGGFFNGVLLFAIAGFVGINGYYNAVSKISSFPSQPAKNSSDNLKNLFNLSGQPFLGSEDAPLTIIEFADPACPFCKKLHEESLKPILAEYKDKLKYYYLYAYGHCPNAEEFFAILESCKSFNKYFECIDLLYKAQGQYYTEPNPQVRKCVIDKEKLKSLITQIGIEYEEFAKIYSQINIQQLVQNIQLNMGLINLQGTPTLVFLIDNNYYTFIGFKPKEELKLIIERFLNR